MLCLTFAFAIACGNIEVPNGPDGPSGGGNKLPSVSSSSVTFNKEGESLWVSWAEVEGAQNYEVKFGSASVTTQTPLVDLATISGFSMPTTGQKITVTIIAKGDGYKNSSPTSVTYEEGKQLSSPEILSFANGIITWRANSNAKKYTVKVDGAKAAETTSNTFDASALNGNVKIEITASNGSSSATLTVIYNSASGKLSMPPVTDYTVSGDILRWSAVGGASGYKVFDLDFNSYVVTTTHYIMSIRNLVYGVYPVMPATSVVESAEIVPVDIKYLNGSGTATDPYIIKTPFDLRAIDYYEFKSTETGSTAQNNYKIVGDIDYNTVSALEDESNIFTLRKPFFGVLDGDNHTLSNMEVHYNYGFWALFEHIATDGVVKNIKFDNAKINNSVQDEEHPVNPATAMVAYRNYGEVSAVTLSNSKFNVTAGGAAGLVIHNYGKITGCTVKNCDLVESATNKIGTAAYEMAGIALENLSGGEVSGCTVNILNIYGAGNNTSGNIGSSAGIVAINRTRGTVTNNSYDAVTIKNLKTGKEAGGVVAYCANGGNVSKGTGTLGTLTVGTSAVNAEMGNATTPHGKLYGKKG